MGGDIYDVNAEYAWQDHSWYAILSFFFLSSPPVSSHSHPLCFYPFLPFLSLISCSWLILTLCRAAHLLQVDFVDMHGKCTMRDLRGVPHVRGMCDKSPTQALLQDILQNGSVLVLLLCSGIPPSSPSPLPLLSLSSPPPLPLLSPSSPPPNLPLHPFFFLLLSDPPNIH